ncbi:MAG: hypothetical protein ICV66_04260, partial [Chitinophagaceae bacterium]|nr:hypothetical protein [Chitinophagaceae bacterium]
MKVVRQHLFAGKRLRIPFCVLMLLQFFFAAAQDKRAQYPSFLSNAYFSVNVGYINYPFAVKQMEAGYSVQSVHVPHTAARLVLYGQRINKYLSAQITYMRPVNWVEYR